MYEKEGRRQQALRCANCGEKIAQEEKAQCDKHVYNTGDCWTENTAVHGVRTAGTTNARFTITYGIAKGQPRRIDEPAPACAAALGLE